MLVSNRKASAELVAILEKMDVVERQKGKLALEDRQVRGAWPACRLTPHRNLCLTRALFACAVVRSSVHGGG